MQIYIRLFMRAIGGGLFNINQIKIHQTRVQRFFAQYFYVYSKSPCFVDFGTIKEFEIVFRTSRNSVSSCSPVSRHTRQFVRESIWMSISIGLHYPYHSKYTFFVP